MRVFLAVPSEPMWVDSARGLIDRLRSSLPRASWTRPESWHLTLQFLGDVDAVFVERFIEAMEPTAFETVPGEIQAGPGVVFPEHGRPRVLGVGFFPSPGLESISRLAAAAQEGGGTTGPEDRGPPFHAHVTFARLRDPCRRRRWTNTAARSRPGVFPAWQARSCVVFESRLDPAGAVHVPLHEWTFQGGPRGVRA